MFWCRLTVDCPKMQKSWKFDWDWAFSHVIGQVDNKNAKKFQKYAFLRVPAGYPPFYYICYIVIMPLVEKLHIPCHFWNNLRVFTYSLHHLDITLYDLKTSKDLWHQVRVNWKITEELWADYCRTLGRLQIYKRKTNWRQNFGYWWSSGGCQRPLEPTDDPLENHWRMISRH